LKKEVIKEEKVEKEIVKKTKEVKKTKNKAILTEDKKNITK